MKSFIIALLSLVSSLACAQEGKVLGKLVDAKTNKPIKDAHIVLTQTSKGTLSNALGFFELTDHFPANITISHINYIPSQVALSADKPTIKILLEPVVYALPALSVKDSILQQPFHYKQVAYQQGISHIEQLAKEPNPQKVYELNCTFPGGTEEFHTYLFEQILKQEDLAQNAFSTKVLFTVDKAGMIKVDTLEGITGQKAEAMKHIFAASPKWIPAIQGQQPVAIRLSQQIEYHPKAEIFRVVDQQPEYTGGMGALFSLFSKNLVYPKEAKKAGVGGKVYVSFVINQAGGVENAQVVQGIGYGCDQEALRLVELSSGKWTPGKQAGKPVKVRMQLPVIFKP